MTARTLPASRTICSCPAGTVGPCSLPQVACDLELVRAPSCCAALRAVVDIAYPAGMRGAHAPGPYEQDPDWQLCRDFGRLWYSASLHQEHFGFPDCSQAQAIVEPPLSLVAKITAPDNLAVTASAKKGLTRQASYP
jgi:hypothetical protein